MQNVPKIVSDRLRAAAPAVNHPDADVLTAFSERSLSELERGIVLEHLARCVDCRDIVALALPATEPVVKVIRPHGGWLTWPALRWGFVAAGVLAVASVGMLRLRRHPSLQTASSQLASPQMEKFTAKESRDQLSASPVPAPLQKQTNIDATPALSLTDSRDRENVARSESKLLARSDVSPAPFGGPRIGTGRGAGMAPSGFPHGPRMAMQQQQGANALQQAPSPATPPSAAQAVGGNVVANAPVSSMSETVEVQSSAAEVAQNQNLDLPNSGRSRSEEASSALDDSAKVGKAKPAETMQVQISGAATPVSTNPPAQPEALRAYAAAPTPRWTISSTGNLQRSIDQGKTWQVVDVSAHLAATNITELQVVAGTSRAKALAKDTRQGNKEAKKEDERDTKALNERAAAVTFRAVAANGAEVWAGGSGGALYHSSDAGNHWLRIVPAAAGTILTSDIVAVEFSDAQHGRITTADPAVWTTSDAGVSWEKQ